MLELRHVIAAVLRRYHFPQERLTGTTRKPAVCDARGMICTIATQTLELSGNEIGRFTHASGSHTSVITARARFKRRLADGAITEPVGRDPRPLAEVYAEVLRELHSLVSDPNTSA